MLKEMKYTKWEQRLKHKRKCMEEDAFKAREFHYAMIERCRSMWKKIAELEQKASLSEADTDQLEALKHQFTLVIFWRITFKLFVWPTHGSTEFVFF